MKEHEIEIGNGEHLTITTPQGRITLFIGEHHRSITSYVDDVELLGFYTKKTTKKTHKSSQINQKMVQLKAVEE
jgi:hypothetical protein